MDTLTLDKAKSFLARACDVSLTKTDRSAAYAEADQLRKQLHVGWSKIGDVPADLATLIETSVPASTTGKGKAPAKEGKTSTKTAKAPVEKKPLVAGHLVLRNPIQVALFNEFIRDHIVGEQGHWGPSAKPAGHHEPWAIAKVRAAKEGEPVGIDYAAPKMNYNINDSNWVRESVLDKMTEIAVKANKGKPVTKKHLLEELKDMKGIFMTRLPETEQVSKAA
jgi:hypothetical protein